jgi:hypothetical protein
VPPFTQSPNTFFRQDTVTCLIRHKPFLSPPPFAEVEMAKKQTRSRAEETRSGADRLTHPLLEKLGAIPAAQAELFAYSVKIVCGKQTETNCCCVAGARPGVYATEVNIQNLNLVPAPVVKLVIPLINSGAIVAREPNVADPFALPGRAIAEAVRLPPLGATMDDCCRIAELLLGAPPSGDTGLTIAILTIVSLVELSVSAVYTANPLSGDGISIDVEYIPSRRLGLRGRD